MTKQDFSTALSILTTGFVNHSGLDSATALKAAIAALRQEADDWAENLEDTHGETFDQPAA